MTENVNLGLFYPARLNILPSQLLNDISNRDTCTRLLMSLLVKAYIVYLPNGQPRNCEYPKVLICKCDI